MNKAYSEDRCLKDGCQLKIACSICGGCEEQHEYNLMYGKCNIEEVIKNEN